MFLNICYCTAIILSSSFIIADQLRYRVVKESSSDANPTERKLNTAENSTTTTKSPKKTLLQTLTSRKYDDVQLFYKTAMESSDPPTDKVTDHAYSEMYGLYLLPYIRAQHRDGKKIKFLEIGLGCKMDYGPGVSVKLWKNIFQPSDEIWEAEYEADCVANARKENKLKGINVVTGDQGNFTDLNRWVKESGGNFDIVIDDGGHNHVLIRNSLEVLWPQVKPGGLYFIEDLQVEPTMTNHIKGWVDQLLLGNERTDHPSLIPKDVRAIMCQREACVLSKCKEDSNGGATRCSPF